MKAILEVCVDSAAGLAAAIDGGADRIELCSSLALGGLTPSAGLMATAAASPVPVYAMIRPHADGFVYSTHDEAAMAADIDTARRLGLAGIVTGALTPGGTLDLPCLARLLERAAGMGKTLHRVVDLLPAPEEAVGAAADLGFHRILSSGGAAAAAQGLPTLAKMVEVAAGRVRIMPGGAVRASNVVRILAGTGAIEVHASCSSLAPGATGKDAELGLVAPSRKMTDSAAVKALKKAIDAS